jgi:hypothetical protein
MNWILFLWEMPSFLRRDGWGSAWREMQKRITAIRAAHSPLDAGTLGAERTTKNPAYGRAAQHADFASGETAT